MLSRSRCFGILEPHHSRIRRIVTRAWDDYQDLLRTRPFLGDYKRARANMVHAAMKAFAHEEFEGVAGSRVARHEPDSFMLVFDEALFVRVKKLDRETLLPSNVATEQNDEMLRQIPLPGHGPNPSYPVAGYVLNKLESSIESVHVVMPMGDYNLWTYEIGESGESSNVHEMPTLWPLDDLTRTVVKPKRKIKEREATEGDEIS